MPIIDTHCHLDFQEFDADRESVFERAAEAGVRAFLLIGTNPDSWDATKIVSNGRPNVVRALGVHPTSVADNWTDGIIDNLRSALDAPDIVALGEIGLDFYRSNETRDIQLRAFQQQLELARALDLPVVIHQRGAEDRTLDVLRDYPSITTVVHCFSGDVTFAQDCLELGCYLGIGGIATYRNAELVREAISSVPIQRLILETDAPFLAPQPWRGKRNEPAYLSSVVETMSEVYQENRDTIELQTSRTAIKIFGSRLGEAADTASAES